MWQKQIEEIVVQLKKRPILTILFVSLLIRLVYLYFNHPLWWDSHVYVGMGKYIFSNGQIGIWESFRPLVHPIILGTFWYFRLDPVIVGKILDLVFSLTSIYLVHLLGKQVFNKKTGLIAAGIFSLTPLFIMYTGLILTEPLAITLGLWGTYLFLKGNKWGLFFAGILLSLSFQTKFPQGIIFAGIILIMLLKKEKIIDKIKTLSAISTGFIITTVPYMIFNYFRYPNILEPFISGAQIVTTSTWIYGAGKLYYLNNFFLSNWIYLFFFGYFYYFFKEKNWKNQQHNVLVLISILFLLYFSFHVPRKEIRYLTTTLPFFTILMSYTITKIYHKLKTAPSPFMRPKAFIIICVILLAVHVPVSITFETTPTFEKEIQQTIEKYQLQGTILTTDPSFVSFSEQPIVILSAGMQYGPKIYQQQQGKYELIYINDCDLLCAPGDNACEKEKETFLQQVYVENTIEFQKIVKNCTYIIGIPK